MRNPDRAIRSAKMVARRMAGGGSLSDAINSFSRQRKAQLTGPDTPSALQEEMMLASLANQPRELAVAEPPQQSQPPAMNTYGDLGDEIERGAKFLEGVPDEDTEAVKGKPTKESVIEAATGHQAGNAPPVVSGVQTRAVQHGNAPPLITTKSYEPGDSGVGSLPARPFGPAKGGDPMPVILAGIRHMETRGVKNPYGYVSPAGALGAYGIMPETLAAWSERAGYKGITPREFIASPEAQDAVAAVGAKDYFDQYGGDVGSVGQAWLGGPGSVGKEGVKDPWTGMSTADYGRRLSDYVGRNYRPQTENAASAPAPAPPPPPSPPPQGPQAQADPMSNLYDKVAFSPDVQSGYDNPQVMFDPNDVPSAARGGYLRRAGGGPAYSSMPTNELIDKALRIIRKHRDSGGGVPPPKSIAQIQQQMQAADTRQAAMALGSDLNNQRSAGSGSQFGGASPEQAQYNLYRDEVGFLGTPPTTPSPAGPPPPNDNTPAVKSGTVGNQGNPTGAGINDAPTSGPPSYDPASSSLTGPTSPIPMASPTGFNGYNYNNSLDQVLGTNNPTQNQIFGFNYPQNLPPPKPQPEGPVSQNEINGLYGFGGGSQMGTGTFQSGGAIIMDALNRARKASGGRTITPKDMAAILQNLPNSDGTHKGYYDDDSKSASDYAPIASDDQVHGYSQWFNNPPQSDANWSSRDSDYRSYPSTNEQAIRSGGKVKGKR